MRKLSRKHLEFYPQILLKKEICKFLYFSVF